MKGVTAHPIAYDLGINPRAAAPRAMILKLSPIACAPAEHAVAVAELGPLALWRIETCPEARLTMADGIKNGETRPGPSFKSFSCSRSMAQKSPMPLLI